MGSIPLLLGLAAISEFPAIRNLLDRIEQLESQPCGVNQQMITQFDPLYVGRT